MIKWTSRCIDNIYTYSQLDIFLEHLRCREFEIQKLNRSVQVYNIPAAFDIETSSWLDSVGKKHAMMYVWQLGIDGVMIYGRTWEEFMFTIGEVTQLLDLGPRKRLFIYVHNLAFEFQFFRKLFNWETVFNIKNRRPVRALTDMGIEFRCSYFLSNYSLEYLGDNLLKKYPLKKLVGDLDYSLIRHSETPLSEQELQYCVNDIRIVMNYIQEKIENEGGIIYIPLTNTGYVRRYCRSECFYDRASDVESKRKALLDYHSLMKSLRITDNAEYYQLKRATSGGFTHASCLYSGKDDLQNVESADRASAYPYEMVCKYFPMSRATYIGTPSQLEDFQSFLKLYCCVFDIEFINLQTKFIYENILSAHKCSIEGDHAINNGRIVHADKVRTTMTELDFDSMSKFYTWSEIRVTNLRIYQRGYLPKPLILSILKLYEDKTKLKGIVERETEYMVSKNMINAAFGMMVTAIIRDEVIYGDDHEWSVEKADLDSQLDDYNNSFSRFLYYGWGVWVTAHARHELMEAILEMGEDYVYSDTDSVKGFGITTSHKKFFKHKETEAISNLLKMCTHYDINFSKCMPEDPKGKKHLLGAWEYEGKYDYFKTLGAKRYMVIKDNWLTLTMAGLNKRTAVPYMIAVANGILLDSEEFRDLQRAYSGKPEDFPYFDKVLNKHYDLNKVLIYFADNMYIPADYTGKLTMTYIDHEDLGTVIDYLGIESSFHEFSSVHAEKQSYFLSLVGEYIKYLNNIQEVLI